MGGGGWPNRHITLGWGIRSLSVRGGGACRRKKSEFR